MGKRHTMLPAEFTGDYGLLLERLEQGIATDLDQQWAARILRASPVPLKVAGGETRARDREYMIYLQVLGELEKGHTPTRAFQVVAARHTTARGYDDGSSAREDSKRPLSAKRVGEIYRLSEARGAALARFLEERRHDLFPDFDGEDDP
ncbi:hypothetical protein [Pseudoxanthomonas sp.]|uniref:hypothetical protein n=1 Tax=Pseudoxanthomonas sp. TaxID=1871049 RepID=UPI0025FD0EA4|nr:hypothetical protein [Pseudoxanthomonas sp.]